MNTEPSHYSAAIRFNQSQERNTRVDCAAGLRRKLARLHAERQPAECNSAIRQIKNLRYAFFSLALILTVLIGCSRSERDKPSAATPNHIRPAAIVLAPHEGADPIDLAIRKVQQQIRDGKDTDHGLERLGWLFVSKARRSFDPGFYQLAEQCALELDSRQPHCPEGLLLRGHVLQNLHRFRQAEPLARELTAHRGLPFDFGLLSDVLMEQGKIEEAIEACQKMLDLRPELQSYARGAHLRWLRGDLAGALDLMRLATAASSPLDTESAAWVYSRLAIYQFQSGDPAAANESCAAALDYLSNYP